MLKYLGYGILSVGILSFSSVPATAQNISTTPIHSNLITQNKSFTTSISKDPNSNLETSAKASDLEDFTVKNSLDFASIGQLVDSEDYNLVSQRTRTRTTRTRSRSKYKYSAGFDLINFGWVKDENGSISSILGFNVGLGIGYRKYFSPTEDGKFNFAYTLGTFALVFPFAGLGVDYQWEAGWYAGAHAVVLPATFFIDDFLFPVLPTLAVGYRW